VLLAWRITHALSLRTPHRPWFCKESRQGVLVCCLLDEVVHALSLKSPHRLCCYKESRQGVLVCCLLGEVVHALSLRTPHRPWFRKKSRQGALACCCCCCLRLRRLHHMIMRGCRQWTPAPSTDAITYIHAGGLTHYSVHTRTHTLTHYIDNICAPITHTH